MSKNRVSKPTFVSSGFGFDSGYQPVKPLGPAEEQEKQFIAEYGRETRRMIGFIREQLIDKGSSINAARLFKNWPADYAPKMLDLLDPDIPMRYDLVKNIDKLTRDQSQHLRYAWRYVQLEIQEERQQQQRQNATARAEADRNAKLHAYNAEQLVQYEAQWRTGKAVNPSGSQTSASVSTSVTTPIQPIEAPKLNTPMEMFSSRSVSTAKTANLTEQQTKPSQTPSTQTPITKPAVISIYGNESDASTAESSGVALRTKPDASSALVEGGRVPLNAKVFALTEVKTADDAWVSVTTPSGRQGWIAKRFVHTAPGNDGGASRYKVPTGSGGYAINIAKRYYGDFVSQSQNRDQDLRYFVGVLEFVNRGKSGGIFKPEGQQNNQSAEAWKSTHAKAGEYIWIPSLNRALELNGRVPGGSLTSQTLSALQSGATQAGEFILGGASFVGGLFHGIGDGLIDMVKAIPELLGLLLEGARFVLTNSVGDSLNAIFNGVHGFATAIPELASKAGSEISEKWNQSDPVLRWHYRGWLIGNILANVVLTFIDGIGLVKGVAALGKAGQIGKVGALAVKIEQTAAFATINTKLEASLAAFAKSAAGQKLAQAGQKAQGAINTAGTKLNQGLENAAQAVDDALGQGPTPAFAAATVNGSVASIPMNASTMTGATTAGLAVTASSARANYWIQRLLDVEGRYTKFTNWAYIKANFLGKAATEINLPPDYKFAIVDGRKYAYLEKPDASKIPLLRSNDAGEWDVRNIKNPTYRIAEQTRYANNYGTKILDSGSQIHHLYADNIWRQNPLLQEILRRGIANMDQRSNLVELAETAADVARAQAIDAKFPSVPHLGEHPLFDREAETLLGRFLDRSRRNYQQNNVLKFTDRQLLDTVKDAQNELLRLLIEEPARFPRKPNGGLAEVPSEESGEA